LTAIGHFLTICVIFQTKLLNPGAHILANLPIFIVEIKTQFGENWKVIGKNHENENVVKENSVETKV
jgi:hypothetical protein